MSAGTRITVGEAAAGQRLDRYLATRKTWGTRSHVQRLISAGLLRLDGHPAKAGTLLRAGQTIEVCGDLPAAPLSVEPEAIALDIVYEDEWLLVINKPPGMVVHPAPGNWRGTLVSALLHHWGAPRPGLDPLRPGIVHRLDKDTSGVLVIAKDPGTLADLGAQFHARQVEKQYLAFVWGTVRGQRFSITQPIGRNPVQRKRMAVRAGGREAETVVEVLQRFEGVTLVRLFPKTGRTHQIRVHLAAIGHPIVGDAVYGRGRARDARLATPRQALHAERIAFRHPCSGARMSFAAPLPRDMMMLQQRLAHPNPSVGDGSR